jgi:hypothetical protein
LQKFFLIYATPKLFGESRGIAIQNREAMPAKGWAKCSVAPERRDFNPKPGLRKRDSAAMLGAHETVRAAEGEKHQNHQGCDQQKRVHHFLFSRLA